MFWCSSSIVEIYFEGIISRYLKYRLDKRMHIMLFSGRTLNRKKNVIRCSNLRNLYSQRWLVCLYLTCHIIIKTRLNRVFYSPLSLSGLPQRSSPGLDNVYMIVKNYFQILWEFSYYTIKRRWFCFDHCLTLLFCWS